MTLSSFYNYQAIDNNSIKVDKIITDNDHLPTSFDVLKKMKEILYLFLISMFLIF